jgi:hypothetical protein
VLWPVEEKNARTHRKLKRTSIESACYVRFPKNGTDTDKNSLFSPRHDFFSLDAGALSENCFSPIRQVASSEIQRLCASLALVSGKRPALVQSSSRSTCAPVPSLSFIVNLGNGALSLGVATLAPDT